MHIQLRIHMNIYLAISQLTIRVHRMITDIYDVSKARSSRGN